jgi:hypothetical protein
MPAPPRPLHARLAAADVVALGVVERVELGRIAVRDGRARRGAPGGRFEVKRPPSRPPTVAAGDRVLWLLDGARSPFVLVDEPREVVVLANDADVERWAAQIGELLAADGDAERRLRAYLSWIDGTDDALRGAAVAAIGARPAAPTHLPRGVAVERARIALDPARPPAVRRASAAVAAGSPEGVRVLIAGVRRGTADAAVVQVALSAGLLQGSDGLHQAVIAALRSSDAEVRRASLPAAASLASVDGVRQALARMAEGDPDPAVRKAAQRALGHASPGAS